MELTVEKENRMLYGENYEDLLRPILTYIALVYPNFERGNICPLHLLTLNFETYGTPKVHVYMTCIIRQTKNGRRDTTLKTNKT